VGVQIVSVVGRAVVDALGHHDHRVAERVHTDRLSPDRVAPAVVDDAGLETVRREALDLRRGRIAA
jgi:hypothetical protein